MSKHNTIFLLIAALIVSGCEEKSAVRTPVIIHKIDGSAMTYPPDCKPSTVTTNENGTGMTIQCADGRTFH